MVYRISLLQTYRAVFLHMYRASNPAVFPLRLISGPHPQSHRLLTADANALSLPRVLGPPLLYDLMGLVSFPHNLSGERGPWSPDLLHKQTPG